MTRLACQEMSSNKQELEDLLKEGLDLDSKVFQDLKVFMISLDREELSKTLLEIFLRSSRSSLEEEVGMLGQRPEEKRRHRQEEKI